MPSPWTLLTFFCSYHPVGFKALNWTLLTVFGLPSWRLLLVISLAPIAQGSMWCQFWQFGNLSFWTVDADIKSAYLTCQQRWPDVDCTYDHPHVHVLICHWKSGVRQLVAALGQDRACCAYPHLVSQRSPMESVIWSHACCKRSAFAFDIAAPNRPLSTDHSFQAPPQLLSFYSSDIGIKDNSTIVAEAVLTKAHKMRRCHRLLPRTPAVVELGSALPVGGHAVWQPFVPLGRSKDFLADEGVSRSKPIGESKQTMQLKT